MKQEKELEFARLKQKEEFELTKLKFEAEERERAREAEERVRDRARQAELTLELNRLELGQAQNVTVVGAAPTFRLENAIKLLPKFN